ncbi:MAG: choice-of-anchor X domain-containing protein [Candidatus Zhuqueibacterota bacterium]
MRFPWKTTLVLSMLIIMTSCENDDPVSPKNSVPVLSALSVPDTMLSNEISSYIFSVKCSDQDGLGDIQHVNFSVTGGAVNLTGALFDDGNYDAHGDNIANDGKFSLRLSATLEPGMYQLTVKAIDQSEAESNALSRSFVVAQGIVNAAPIITQIFIPDSVVVDQVVPFVLQVHAVDQDSGDVISRVTYQILGPTVSELAEQGELYDDGVHSDSLANDHVFGIETNTAFSAWKFGLYHVSIQAYDSRDKVSESIYVVLPWKKMDIGVAPVVFDLSAPDTIQLPSTGEDTRLITIAASDADDNRDIKNVFFNSYKPDGQMSASSPLFMYDDGTSGDVEPGNHIYSLQIRFPYNTTPGNYRFEFQARDYSDLLSNKIIHIVTVKK